MKLRTPIATLNIIGAGGIEWNSVIECWGPPKGGKSTFCYQVAGYALQDYPDNVIVLILDSETSGGLLRLRKVFGLSPCNVPNAVNPNPNIFIEPAFTFEKALLSIGKYLEKANKENKGLIAIWDSITASQPSAEYEAVSSAINKIAGSSSSEEAIELFKSGMMIRPRMLKFCLNNLLSMVFGNKVAIFLINQATTSINKYSVSETSSGGYALKHNIHYRFKFDYVKDIGQAGGDVDKADDVYKSGTLSNFHVSKSKHGAVIFNIPVFISDTEGGKIQDGQDILHVALRIGLLEQKGPWIKFITENTPADLNKSWYMKDLNVSQLARDFAFSEIKKYFRNKFKLLDWEYEELEQ